MYRTMLDLIKPKLVYLDLPLFMALLSDLFPGVEVPTAEGGELKAALEADLKAHGLQVVPEYMTKIIQVCSVFLLSFIVTCQDSIDSFTWSLHTHQSVCPPHVIRMHQMLCRSLTVRLQDMET